MSHIDKGAVVPALQLGHRVAQRIQEQIVGGQDIALQVELDGRLRLVQRIDDALHVLPFDLGLGDVVTDRSEEHTSELQSLMRISYAVFCLKKKQTDITNNLQYQLTCLHINT